MDSYLEHYQLLGLQAGDSWQTLRRAYRSQMRRWHPDRFGRNDAERQRAEERTKAINQAYQELVAFYEQHGKLPLDAEASPPSVATTQDWPAEPGSGWAAGATSAASQYTWQTPPSAVRHGLRNTLLIGALAVIVLALVTWKPDDTDTVPEPTLAAAPSVPSTLNNGHAGETALLATEAQFGVGSTFGEVHAIQGTPTQVNGDTWQYGEARVHFRDGRVISWIDSEPPRLKVSSGGHPTATPAPKTLAAFARGSTKDQVRSIQGTPLRESEEFWDYGLSRVYFDRKGLVSGWQESPLDPLRVQH